MKIERMNLLEGSKATLTAYLLDDGEFSRKGLLHNAVLICPGGGYSFVSQNEGEPIALAFLRQGYNAFILDYSVKIEHPFPQALLEAAKAISVIKEHEKEWMIKPKHISVIGFSAGGNLALALSIFYNSKIITDKLGVKDYKPDFTILGYPAVQVKTSKRKGEMPKEYIDLMDKGLMPDFRGPSIQEIILGKLNPTKEEIDSLNLTKYFHSGMSPIFCFGTYEDPIIPVDDLLELGKTCDKYNIPFELHIFQKGTHGMSLADETVKFKEELEGNHIKDWTVEVFKWLKEQE